MKKILLLFGILLFAFNLSAQNYDSYLQKAYSALEEGKIEVAQSFYNVYKKMTEKTDLDFETLIKDADVNAWKSSCYIIDYGNGKYIAVQKIDSSQVKLSYEAAMNRCKSSRLGGFNDWRLPTLDELHTVLSTINLPIKGFYWTAFHVFSEKGDGKIGSNYYMRKSEWIAINDSGEENHIMWQGGWSSIYVQSAVYLNGKKISSDFEAVPKYNYIIIRQFTK